MKKYRVGIVGVSGYGGGELLRLVATHPSLELVYVAGESSAGSTLGDKFPSLAPVAPALAELRVEAWSATSLPPLDLLFASLPTGASRAALGAISAAIKIVDIGGDHRFADGWTYGLADVWPDEIRKTTRLANPGCYAAASIGAIAPLLAAGLVDPDQIIIDAKSGVSGAGRGGGTTFGYAEVNEDVAAYALHRHPHVPEINQALSRISSAANPISVTFAPHLVPMTRGLLATCYLQGDASTADCIDAATRFYERRPFVRVFPADRLPHTKWANGSNVLFVAYAADPSRRSIVALGAIDNLGKGAAGQALQNANLMLGLDETAGLQSMSFWP